MKPRRAMRDCAGTSLLEVLMAMVIVPIALLGAMGAFHAAGKTIAHGTFTSRALAMTESRIEAKRATQWQRLLEDDVDHDGLVETVMHDDGEGSDLVAGDGTYSASREQEGILLTWTLTCSRGGNLNGSSYVILEARASYESGQGRREVKMATLRANPLFVGQ
jgi:type II secretory pathway component PulJ